MGHKELIKTEKEQLLQFLIVNSHNGKLLHGKINEAATRFDCGRRTVSRMWATAKQQLEKDEVIHVPMNRPGLKRKHEINLEEIQSIHYQKRGNIRDLAAEIKVPKTLVGVWAKKGLIRAHTSAIRPELTAPNKLHRLSFSLQAIEYDQMLNILKFKQMQNVIHIDEKWFYLTKKTHRCYMAPMEEDPYISCKIKNFILKVMFVGPRKHTDIIQILYGSKKTHGYYMAPMEEDPYISCKSKNFILKVMFVGPRKS